MAMSGPQPATAEAYVAARPSAQSGSSGDPCQMARRGPMLLAVCCPYPVFAAQFTNADR
jgi:hypothetical protein